MTIKQKGGIFGRNPSFNNVTVNGSLTLNNEVFDAFGTMTTQDADNVNIDGGSIDGVTIGAESPVAEASVDNLKLDGNIVSSTNTNGDIIFDANGTGGVTVQGVSGASTGAVNTPVIFTIKDNDDIGSGGDTTKAWGKLKWETVDGSSGGPGGGAEIGVSYTTQFGVGARMYIATSENNAAPKKRMQFEPYGNIQMYQNDGVTKQAEFVAASGNLELPLGNLVIGTSGKGIDFSATGGSGTSELLDDYEEGTWTPVLSDGTNNAAMTGNNFGNYTKIGDMVFVTARVQSSNATSLTGNLQISGLPFVVGTSQANRNGITIGATFELSLAVGTSVTGSCQPGQSLFNLYAWNSATRTNNLTDANVKNFAQFWLSGSYKV